MDAQKLSRRDFLSSVALGGAATLLAACQPAPSAPVEREVTRIVAGTPQVVKETVVVGPAAEPQVEIRFEDEAELGPEGFKVFTDVLIPKFEQLNPNIKVKFEPATGDWSQKITAQMAAGNAPDVMVAYGNEARQWMESGQLLPLEDVFTTDELEDFYEAQLVAFRVNNHLYEIPKYVSCVVLAYNVDLFDAAGLEYPSEDWTWDEFLIAAEKLTVRDAADKASQWGYRVMQSYIQHWVWSNGGEWMDKDAMGTKILIDEPKAMEALRFNWNLQWKYKYSPAPQEMEGVGHWDTFQTGKLGFTEHHSWQVTDYLARNNFRYDYTLLPKAPTGMRVGHIFADGYGIYAQTKQKEAALTFLRYITSPEVEREMCVSALGLQPSRKSVASVWDTLSEGAKAGKNVQAFSEMAKIARLDPYFKDHAKVREIFVPLWESIWITGTMGLEEGVAEIVKRVNEYLATVT